MSYSVDWLKDVSEKINKVILNETFEHQDEDALFDILDAVEEHANGKRKNVSFSVTDIGVLEKYNILLPTNEVTGYNQQNITDLVDVETLVEPSGRNEKEQKNDNGEDVDDIQVVETIVVEQATEGTSVRLGEIGRELAQHIADKDFEPLTNELTNMGTDGASLLVKLRKQEENRFSELVKEADAFIRNKDYERAKKSLASLKDLRGQSPKIDEFEKLIFQKSNQVTETQEVREAKSLLRRHDSYAELLKGLELARNILKSKDEHDLSVASLRVLYDEAEVRRQELAQNINAAQTMGAIKDFKGQVEAYAELMEQQLFETEDPDDATKKVKVSDLHRKALENLREAQEGTVRSRFAKAKDVYTADPQLAVSYLNEIEDIVGEFKGTDLYNEYTEINVPVQKNLKAWQKADKHFNDAVGLSLRERLKKYEQAKVAFSAYRGLNEKIEETKDAIRAEIARGAYVQLKQQEIRLNMKAVDIPFGEIEKVFEHIRDEINQLGDPVGGLVEVETKLGKLQQKTNEYKQRHDAIKDVRKLLQKELDKETPSTEYLEETLASLKAEDCEHALLREERLRIGRLKGDKGKYDLAKAAFRKGDFLEAIAHADGINPDGDLGRARGTLIQTAEYYLSFEKAKIANKASNYAEARSILNDLLTKLSEAPVLTSLQPFYQEVQVFSKDIREEQEKTVTFEKDFLAAKESYALNLDERLNSLQAMLDEYPDRKALLDEIAETEKALEAELVGQIKDFKEAKDKLGKKSPTPEIYKLAEKALNASNTLEVRKLLKDTTVKSLAKWVRDIYPSLEANFYISKADWDKLLGSIKERYGDDLENLPFHIEALVDDAKRSKALSEARKALSQTKPDWEKAQKTLDKAIEENEKLSDDAEIAILRSIIFLYGENPLEARRKLLVAEQDKGQAGIVEQIHEIIEHWSTLRQRETEAEQYASEEEFGLLDVTLSDLDSIFEDLTEIVEQEDAKQFLTYLEGNYRSHRAKWSQGALTQIRADLHDGEKSVAEKVMLLFKIRQLEPENPIVMQQLGVISPDIPQTLRTQLRVVRDYYEQEKYRKPSVQNGLSTFIALENTLRAFKELERLDGQFAVKQSDTLAAAIAEVKSNGLFSAINTELKGLREAQSKLQELADTLAPYFEYRNILKGNKEVKGISDDNICFLYECGKDRDGRVKEILDSQIAIDFDDNLDLKAFVAWAKEVDEKRSAALQLIEQVKTGLKNGFGENAGRDDGVLAGVDKKLYNYKMIIEAIRGINRLTPPEHRYSNDGNTASYEDIYCLNEKLVWQDDYSGKVIDSITEHYGFTVRRRDVLTAYRIWYERLENLSVPRQQDENVLLPENFEDIKFDNGEHGVKQEVEFLQGELAKYRKEFNEAIVNPIDNPLDNLSDNLLLRGEDRIAKLEEEESVIQAKLSILEAEITLPKLKSLERDMASRLKPRKPALGGLKEKFIEMHRLDPCSDAFRILFETYEKKTGKSSKSFWRR